MIFRKEHPPAEAIQWTAQYNSLNQQQQTISSVSEIKKSSPPSPQPGFSRKVFPVVLVLGGAIGGTSGRSDENLKLRDQTTHYY